MSGMKKCWYLNETLWTVLAAVAGFGLLGVATYVVLNLSESKKGYEDVLASQRLVRIHTLQEETDKKLTTYGWVNKEAGQVHIPIEVAMKRIVSTLNEKGVNQGPAITKEPIPSLVKPPKQ